MYRFLLLLCLFVMASCAPSAVTPATATLAEATTPVASTPLGKATAPGIVTSSFADATPVSQPDATARAPTTPLANPLPTPPADWKTYTSTSLNLALEYPSDWVVAETRDQIQFRSPQGLLIQLDALATPAEPGNPAESDLPNRLCETLTNAYGVTIQNCLDTIARARTAIFTLLSSDGKAREFVISLRGKGAPMTVFATVLSSVRPAS